MLRIDRKRQQLQPLATTPMAEAGMTERQDLQQLIRHNPQLFFEEMGEDLLLLGEELRPDDRNENRIDLLALDREGAAVVLELKRGRNPYQLLQGLSYAAMLRDWEPERLVRARAELTGTTAEEAGAEIEQFLDTEPEQVGARQRVVLLAEAFDYEVLATAAWLGEGYGVDVRCYKVSLAADEAGEYLSCLCAYPLPELREQARFRGRAARAATGGGRFSSWEEVLEGIENEAIHRFFSEQLESDRENLLSKRHLIFRSPYNGERRWIVAARKDRGYVLQKGRFPGDEAYWQELLGDDCELGTVRGGRALRFYLRTEQQTQAFLRAVTEDLAQTRILRPGEVSVEELDDNGVDDDGAEEELDGGEEATMEA